MLLELQLEGYQEVKVLSFLFLLKGIHAMFLFYVKGILCDFS